MRPNQTVQSRPRWHRLLLGLFLAVFLTGCQKTTQFTYDPSKDLFTEAEQAMEGLGIDYNPPVERTVVVALVMHEGTGLLQEHHLYDFSNVNLDVPPGGHVIISVPRDPASPARWSLVRNETRTSSRAYEPDFMLNRKPDTSYSRINYLIEADLNANISFVLEDDEGNRTITFRVNLTGLE